MNGKYFLNSRILLVEINALKIKAINELLSAKLAISVARE